MTHLSDFSYLQRSTCYVYITAYLIYSIWNNDRFRCLQPHRVFSGELRSIITVLMFTMMTTQMAWDIVSTYVKYKEGFVMLPNGNIIQKPYTLWSPENQKPIQPIDYIQCVTFAFHTGVFFLMQCFWNYLSNSVAKRTFMGSFEFKFYIVWGLASVAMFPILQWRYRDDPLLSEVVPQLAYGCEVLFTACLGIRSDLRFRRLISYSQRKQNSSAAVVIARLSYFRQMNILLTIVLFVYGSCFIILCADGLTDAMVINSTKVACDFLIANVNVCTVFLWLLFISIFHPRRNYAQSYAQTISKSEPGMTLTVADTDNTFSLDTDRQPSQRIANFMAFKANYSGEHPSGEKMRDTSSGVFLRPMTPVNVDYPPSQITESEPLASSGGYPLRNMSVEDPYNNQAVQFPTTNRSTPERFPSAHHDSHISTPDIHTQPTHPPNAHSPSPVSPPYNDYAYREHRERQEHVFATQGYHGDTIRPIDAGGPPDRDRIVTDWLWQTPERKNI